MAVVIGGIIGALVGWILAAATSSGPKTPIEAFRGRGAKGGVGCLGFLMFLVGGAAIGALIGGLLAGA